MKITENLIDKVHKLANQKLHKDFPMLDMAGNEEGSIKRYEVEYIVEAYTLETYTEVKRTLTALELLKEKKSD